MNHTKGANEIFEEKMKRIFVFWTLALTLSYASAAQYYSTTVNGVIVEEKNVVSEVFSFVGEACAVVLKGTCNIIDSVCNFGSHDTVVAVAGAPAGCPVAQSVTNKTTITATKYATVVEMGNAQPCTQTYVFQNVRCAYYQGWIFYNGAWIPAPHRNQYCPAPTWMPLIEAPRRVCCTTFWYN